MLLVIDRKEHTKSEGTTTESHRTIEVEVQIKALFQQVKLIVRLDFYLFRYTRSSIFRCDAISDLGMNFLLY